MKSKLSNISDIILGHSFREAIKNNTDGNHQVIQAKNIQRDGTINTTELTTTFLEKTRTQAFVSNDDILLSNRGTFRAAVYKGNQQNLIAASSVYIIRIHNTDKAIPEYLSVFLNSSSGQYSLELMNSGTLIKSLLKRILYDLVIPLPSIATQKRIVDVHRNYQTRANLYERKTQLEEVVANQTISSLLSQ